MKQPEDSKTLELALAEPRRGRGRPAKADALTQAERSKKYRDAKRAAAQETPIKRDEKKATKNNWSDLGNEDAKAVIKGLRQQLGFANAERDIAMVRITELERDLHNATMVGDMERDVSNEKAERNIALQEKFDLEHLELVDALATIARLEAAAKKPKINPLAAEVRKLKKALKDRDAEHAAIVRAMQDEYEICARLAASRK